MRNLMSNMEVFLRVMVWSAVSPGWTTPRSSGSSITESFTNSWHVGLKPKNVHVFLDNWTAFYTDFTKVRFLVG